MHIPHHKPKLRPFQLETPVPKSPGFTRPQPWVTRTGSIETRPVAETGPQQYQEVAAEVVQVPTCQILGREQHGSWNSYNFNWWHFDSEMFVYQRVLGWSCFMLMYINPLNNSTEFNHLTENFLITCWSRQWRTWGQGVTDRFHDESCATWACCTCFFPFVVVWLFFRIFSLTGEVLCTLSGDMLVNSWQGIIPTLPMIDAFGLTDATAD